MAPRRSLPINPVEEEKSFEQSEEHQILQRIATLEARVQNQHDNNADRIVENEKDIAAIKTDLGMIHDAYQQSEGGRAMRIAIASAIGFAMSVAAFLMTTMWGNVTP